MAYTSVLPVHRLERSIDYVKDRTKTTKSAGSLEEAIDYACNREKTEETIIKLSQMVSLNFVVTGTVYFQLSPNLP